MTVLVTVTIGSGTHSLVHIHNNLSVLTRTLMIVCLVETHYYSYMSTSSIDGIALIDGLQKMFDNAKSKAMLAHHCKYDCQCWDCILQDKYRNSCLECCYRFVCILSCAPHIHQYLKESDRTFLQPTNTQEVYYHCKCDHQDPVAIHCHRYSSRTHKYYDSSGHSYHWQWNTHRHLMVVWLSRTHFTQ